MNRREQMLAALAIGPQWHLRPVRTGVDVDVAALQTPITLNQAGGGHPADAEIAAMDWPTLQAAVRDCRRCALCATRTRSVFGSGTPGTPWMLVGEAPERNEDLQGEPFVGAAGTLLDNMLAAISLSRSSSAYITNAVKCRPVDADGNDRAPSADEINSCRPFLTRQVQLVAPASLIALGKSAAMALLACEPTTTLESLRGSVHRYGVLPLVTTYHPAELLCTPVDKRKSWQDLCLAVDAHLAAA